MTRLDAHLLIVDDDERIRDLLKRHPEIHDIEILRPIIVIGLPRSGTTHLVNLIAADQRLSLCGFKEAGEDIQDGAFSAS